MALSNRTLSEMLELTTKRKASFGLMLDHLMKIENPLIVETGCARDEDTPYGWNGAGLSTVLFNRYINDFSGELHSVDISPKSIAAAQSKIDDNPHLHCSDSVKFLWEQGPKWAAEGRYIDLLYLDSYDFDPANPYPSSAHHMKELCAIMPYLKPGCMVAVDDNWYSGDQRVGKGMYVIEFMAAIGKPMIYDGYQLVWQF